MILLDGTKVKNHLLTQLKEKNTTLTRPLTLTVIQIKDTPASNIYIKQKEKIIKELGHKLNHLKLKETITEKELIDIINTQNKDSNIDGILVQLPLPKHLNPHSILNAIDPTKDVDGLTDINTGRLIHNQETLVPATAKGIINILEYYHLNLTGTHIVIIGRSDIVGKPLANLLLNKNATVTICHRQTPNLSQITKQADILIVAVGIPKFLKKHMIKKDSIIIDVGTNLINNKLVGDVDYEEVKNIAQYLTPVPNGTGPATTIALAQNLYQAHELRKRMIAQEKK